MVTTMSNMLAEPVADSLPFGHKIYIAPLDSKETTHTHTHTHQNT